MRYDRSRKYPSSAGRVCLPSISQPSADVSTGSGCVPWLTCGSCWGSPSSRTFFAADATAMVFARLYWPASSTTSRSRLPRGTRPALAKSHAVPPMTQPSRSATNPGYSFSSISCQLASAPCFFLATSEGSTPAAITSRNRFSTTACDCATTPTRQWFSVMSLAMTAAAVNVFPVPGGPCTARYDESRSSSAVVIDVATSVPRGSCPQLRVRGGWRSRMSMTALGGKLGRPAAMSAAVASMESRSGPSESVAPVSAQTAAGETGRLPWVLVRRR